MITELRKRYAWWKTARLVRRVLKRGTVRDIERLIVAYRLANLHRIADVMMEATDGNPAAYVLERDSKAWQTKIR